MGHEELRSLLLHRQMTLPRPSKPIIVPLHRRDGEIGRLGGLKSPFSQESVGSSPTPGTSQCMTRPMRRGSTLLCVSILLLSCGGSSVSKTVEPSKVLAAAREVHLANLRQLTRDVGENAEAYWAFDGSELIMQSKRPPFACDQIYRLPLDGSRPKLVSTGLGRTTCAYFLPGDKEIVYSSTHASAGECPAVPDRSQGYVWPIYSDYNIYRARADGSNLRKITDTPHYDAEATVCGKDGSIIFTSTRDGDLDLYRMDADGGNVVRLTNAMGYDGGAFFSPDCSQIVWRASRPKGDALEEYKTLLADGLVRPSKLEIYVADADGKNARQLTYLDAASFAPFFHPSGKRVLFSTNAGNDSGREFDIWAINTDGTKLERITFTEGFDGFPMFSPDGTKLAFSSNRNQAKDGETDVYVADWVEEGASIPQSSADKFLDDVAWLADDERGGRGVGSRGITVAAGWITAYFQELGLEPGNAGGYLQGLDVATEVALGDGTSLRINGRLAKADDFVPLGFSANTSVTAKTVFVGHGIDSKELGINEYEGKKLKGKIAVVLRYTPDTEVFRDQDNFNRYSSLHRKAFSAREHGAIGIIIVNAAPPRTEETEEADLPVVALERLGGVGIAAVIVKRTVGEALTQKGSKAAITVALKTEYKESHNIVGRLIAQGPEKLPGVVVVGAHYDHLGMGGETSLGGGEAAIHNGADDNASGVAGLFEVARILLAAKSSLRRDVVFVAFTGEENGLLGSKYFVDNLPEDSPVVAMLNMDMIGRMRSNRLSVFGASTAVEWKALAMSACQEHRIECTVSGGGYGPSDHASFYAAGIPVLFFTTGAHMDYHKPSDDTSGVNAIGGATTSALVATLSLAASRAEKLTFQHSTAPPPAGDRRSFNASLGTIPDYSGENGQPGMLLSGVRPGGAADLAGIKAGDRIMLIGDTEIRNVKDLVYVLQAAKPGEEAVVRIQRDGQTLMLKITFQKSARRKH